MTKANKLNDKTALRFLRNSMDMVLAEVAEKFGLSKLRTGTISYQRDGLSARIQVQAEVASPDGKSKEERDFDAYASWYGLLPEHLHAQFTSRGERFEVIGMLPKRRKYPILARNLKTGKRIVFTTDIVNKLTPTTNNKTEEGNH